MGTAGTVTGDVTSESVLLDKDEYDQLVEDSKFLEALRAAGVDNWDGYDYALDMMKEN